MALTTRARVDVLTTLALFSSRETVAVDTLARRATCSRFMSLILYKKSQVLTVLARTGDSVYMAIRGYADGWLYRRMPGTSRKSALFSVQSRAPRTRAHAAIAKSASRVRARLTDRYRSALTMASSLSNEKADSDGNSDSCRTSSSARRGPRSHS